MGVPSRLPRSKFWSRSKEIFRAMFCLLAGLIYFCVWESKKGCQCSCPVERKGYCISVIVFLYLNSKACKRLPKKLSMGKKKKKKSCQIVLISM